MKAWIWRWGPAIVLMTLIFTASAMPGSELPDLGHLDALTKKGGHMIGYAMLAVSFFHAMSSGRKTNRLEFFAAAGLAILYSVTDEIHQMFTPGRNSSLLDVGIDAVGVFAGLGLWKWIRARFIDRNKFTEAINQD